MDERVEHDILTGRLGDLGALGGALGGGLADGISGGGGGALGGRAGGRWAAKRLRQDVGEVELTAGDGAGGEPEPLLVLARQALAEEGGRLVETTPSSVSAVLGGGTGGLNPVVATVRVEPVATGWRVQVRGVAKEGLVKQRAGEKTAARVAERLAPLLPPA